VSTTAQLPPDRFSEATRQAIARAKQSAIDFKHTHVTPEHMLLGLLTENPSGVARVLERAQATPDQIRQLVLHHLRADEEGIPEHLIAFSERGKRVLEAARQEAQRARSAHVQPEHLLAGLTAVTNTVCGAVLRAVGITTESVRAVVGTDAGAAPAS
jgi:ATP-dependent Clp protease ATP-binding subunit ClpA